MVFLRLVGGTIAATTAAAVVSDTFRYKLDRNIFRPVRNYKSNLDDYEKFQTQEEFYEFLHEFRTGVVNMFRVEDV